MSYRYRNQPLKAIYLTYQLLAFAVRVPVWVLLAIPRSWRPRKSWSIKRVVLVNIVRLLGDVTSKTGPIAVLPNHTAIAPGHNVNGVWVEPTPDLVNGRLQTWMIAASVTPSRIPGYWTHAKSKSSSNGELAIGAPPNPGEKILYHLHGGAYIRLSANPGDVTAAIVRGILEHASPIHRAFSLEYRLSSSTPFPTANPFPAALLDALAGYNYLINVVGFQPADIVLVGDSAGANLALALTRYLIENSESPSSATLPAPPGRLVLLSPWCDLSVSHEGPTASSHAFAASDYIHATGGINYAKDSFLGPLGHGAAVRNAYISPASLDPTLAGLSFAGFPRTFIVAGTAEILYDQIQTLRARMGKDLGEGEDGGLTFYEAKDSVHDHLVFKWHEPQRTETLVAIGKWVDVPL